MFRFYFPYAFLLLPLPWILIKTFSIHHVPSADAIRIPIFETLNKLQMKQVGIHTEKVTVWILYFIWMLLVFAMARPQWVGESVTTPLSGRDILFALDLSNSMSLEDMKLNGKRVDRLTLVKAVAKDFVKKRKGDRVGLVIYGTKAYLQTPLTFDRKTVGHMLEDATIGLAGPQTAIGDAIALSIKHLITSKNTKSRVLVLLSDGENNVYSIEPLVAAELAKENNIKIYTIGLGATSMVTADIFGQRFTNPSHGLDEKTLKEIAQITGGTFFRGTDEASLKQVYDKINKLEPVSSDEESLRPIKEMFFWPLLISLILLLGLMISQVKIMTILRNLGRVGAR